MFVSLGYFSKFLENFDAFVTNLGLFSDAQGIQAQVGVFQHFQLFFAIPRDTFFQRLQRHLSNLDLLEEPNSEQVLAWGL